MSAQAQLPDVILMAPSLAPALTPSLAPAADTLAPEPALVRAAAAAAPQLTPGAAPTPGVPDAAVDGTAEALVLAPAPSVRPCNNISARLDSVSAFPFLPLPLSLTLLPFLSVYVWVCVGGGGGGFTAWGGLWGVEAEEGQG